MAFGFSMVGAAGKVGRAIEELMGFRRSIVSALALAIAISAGCSRHDEEEYRKQVEAWRQKHETDYTREYVPLSALYFLKSGENRAGSATGSDLVLPSSAPGSVGTFVLMGDNTVRFTPAPNADVRINGRASTVDVAVADDGKGKPDEIQVGGLAMWVHRSGDRRTIRVRDQNGPVAKSFKGYTWFPIDDRYRVTARFIKDPAPREVKIPNILGDDESYKTEGTVEFTLDGQKVTMRPMTTRPGRLYFIFKDATSGKETYHTARFLYSDLRPDGTTVLDFNEAYNPPCAFNPYTTCPLPPKENQLAVRVLAGEKAYAGEAPTTTASH